MCFPNAYYLNALVRIAQNSLGFEGQTQSNLCTLLNGLSVNLPRNGEEGFGAPLVLDESVCLAKVVDTSLHGGQWIQCMLGAKCEGVLIGWESVSYLSTNSRVGQAIDCMVVWSIQGIPFVIPAHKNSSYMQKCKFILSISVNTTDQRKRFYTVYSNRKIFQQSLV